MYERFSNPNSHWKAYIDILPRMFDTVVYFTKEEMTVLKHSPCAFREALRYYADISVPDNFIDFLCMRIIHNKIV